MTFKLKQTGFSLIEMMVVVAIIGIVAAIALPNYQEFIKNTRVRTTAESILTGLQKARTEALKRNAGVSFNLDTTDASWVVSCDNPTAACPANIETKVASDSSSEIAITADGNSVVFSSLGIRAVASTMNTVDIDMAGATRKLRIQVGAGGSVRMCDPNISASDSRAC